MSHQKRRTVLRRGGTGLAGVMATSAGCLSTLPLIGDDGPTYTDWLYAPHEISSKDRYPVIMFKPAAIDEHRSQISDSLRELLASTKDDLDPIYFDTIDSVLMVDRSYVIQGEYTRSDVDSTLTQNGFVEQKTYEGYTIYTHSYGSPVALSDDTLMFVGESSSSASDQQVLRSIIDAKQNDIERYTDQNTAFAALSKHLSGDVLWSGVDRTYSSGFSPLSRIDGASLTIAEQSSQLTRVYVFDDESNNVSEVKENVRDTASNRSDGVSFSREENVLLAEMSVQTGNLSVDHITSAL